MVLFYLCKQSRFFFNYFMIGERRGAVSVVQKCQSMILTNNTINAMGLNACLERLVMMKIHTIQIIYQTYHPISYMKGA